MDAQKSSATKDMLKGIMGQFAQFDTEMKIGTRQRREEDENRIAQAQKNMAELEQTLKSETKRRQEMNKSIQSWMDDEVGTMKQDFANWTETSKVHVDQRVAKAQTRLDELEEGFDQMQIDIPALIKKNTDEINRDFWQFQKDFEAEKERRMKEEGKILNRLANHEHHVSSKFDSMRDLRQNKYLELQAEFDKFQKLKMKSEEHFKKYFQEEVADIKNAILLESQVREREDDEMVEAMNRYASQLQKSLMVINDRDIGTYASNK